MLPVCSAVFKGTHHPQVYFNGGLRTHSLGRCLLEEKYISEEKLIFGTPSGIHSGGVFSKVHATRFDLSYGERYEQSALNNLGEDLTYMNSIGNAVKDQDLASYGDKASKLLHSSDHAYSEPLEHSYSLTSTGRIYYIDGPLDSNGSDSIPRSLDVISETGSPLTNELTKQDISGPVELPPQLGNALLNEFTNQNNAVEPETFSSIQLQSGGPSGSELSNFTSVPIQDGENVLSDSMAPESLSITKAPTESISGALQSFNENVQLFYSGISESIDNSINNFSRTLKDAYDEITSSFTNKVDNATDSLVSSVGRTGQQASGTLRDVSDGLRETTFKVGDVTVQFLRKGIVAVEGALGNVGDLVIAFYGSIKSALPSEVQTAATSSEESAKEILRPILSAFQQVYLAIEVLERNLGLDPNDPIIPFLLFVGSTTSIGIGYWLFNYGGYSGDLPPKLALQELTEEEGSVLIDVRPEDLRARDGVPDLRRGARFRYASLDIPKLDDSVRKLLKEDIEEVLLAVVIRNLKIVNNNSKVIVMDANGSQSKSIARSLRKLGIRRSYLLQGGFGSWVANGLRVKELKPETALTILNEETEAILEDIKPTPGKIFVAGLGLAAAIYAVTEWEITLQLIGIIGLGLTLYRRVSSYEDAEDLKSDVRLLLSPVRLGAQALAWTMRKLEPNKIGLPTSPSTTAVQNRVLQAAAKHEALPLEDVQGTTSQGDSTPPSLKKQNLDLTEA